VAGGADTGRSVHADADVALGSHLGLTGMQAHAHLDLRSLGPGVGGQVALGIDGGGHGVVGSGESDEEGIALRIGHLAAMSGEGSEQDLLVGG
jgi:hypothetical protein